MSAEASLAERRAQAAESIATRFTRVMNATTSPRGWMCDLSLAAMVAAIPLVMIVRQAAGGDLNSSTSIVLAAIALVPVVVSIVVGLSLRNAREGVIDWLASVPFPVDNLNSILAGISDQIEVQFADDVAPPDRDDLQRKLEPVSEDTLAMSVNDEQRLAEIKLGVVDHRQVPLRSNHQRYVRLQRVIAEVLVPLHRERAIARVRVI